MSNPSNISIGLMHEVTKTACKAGFETSDFTVMAQNEAKLRKILGYLRGEAEIVLKVTDKVATTIIQKTTDLLKLVKEVALPATGEKRVGECFIGPRYYYRDNDLDNWLPKVQSARTESKSSVWQLKKELTFKEIAQAILGVDEASINDLAKGLVAGGHTVALSQIEALIECTEDGKDVGLRTDGWGNFFFVEDKDGGVSVVRVDRYGRQWDVCVNRLDNDERWRVGPRFFSRN